MSANTLTKNPFERMNKEDITSIMFVKELPAGLLGADISEDKDRSVLTATDGNVLYISSEGAEYIYANKDSSYLFDNFLNLEKFQGMKMLDTSRAEKMDAMFFKVGLHSDKFDTLDLSGFNTSNVKSMLSMFSLTGSNTRDKFIIKGLDGFDTSNVECMTMMFAGAGINAQTFDIGDIGKWDVSNVGNMSLMFHYAANNSEDFHIGDLSQWNIESVVYMEAMFKMCARQTKEFNIGDISNWTTYGVKKMSQMFYGAGRNSKIFNIGDRSKWPKEASVLKHKTHTNKKTTEKTKKVIV